MKKLNKTLSVILAILMVISIIPITASAASATSGKCGDNLTWNYNSTSRTLKISGQGNMYNYSTNSYPWHAYNDEILKIIMSDGITSIGNGVFFYCDKVTNIVIPDGVTKIGYDAFGACYSLESITIPDSVTTISYDAFVSCIKLENITIPNSVTTIYDRAFYSCNSITEVHIPESVKSLGYGVFAGCENLKKITVDEDNQNYMNDEYGALFNKDKTTILQYPAGRTEKSYTIPNSVKTIDEYAFYGCGNLENIVIPKSVTTISEDSFSYCGNLKTIDYTGTTTEWKNLMNNNTEAAELLFNYNINCIDDTIYPSGDFGNVTWYYDNETEVLTFSGEGVIPDFWDRDGYYRERPWEDIIEYKAKSIVIGDGITEIGENSFYTFSALENVTISNVETIAHAAFYDCKSLKTVTIGNNLKVIEDEAFCKCNKFTYIYFMGTQKEWDEVSIGDHCNDEMDKVKVYPIDYKVYSDCGTYRAITGGNTFSWLFDAYSSTLTISGEGDLGWVINLPWAEYQYDIKRIVFSEGITSICSIVFKVHPNIEELVIPASVTSIAEQAFTSEFLTDVYYTGTEAQWNNIAIGEDNDALLNATIHYNYVECVHNYETSIVTSPTCSHIGYTTRICSICNGSCIDEIVECIPHPYTTVVTAPKCTTRGYTTYTCPDCGDIKNDDYVDATGHNFKKSATIGATCTEKGYIKYACANGCGTTKKEITESALGHDYSPAVTFEPTCTAKGYSKQTCTRCKDAKKYDYVDALGHDYVLTSTTAPTCTAQGCAIYQCSLCDATKTEYYADAKGHNYEWTIIVEPTCTVDGTQSGICLECGAETTGGVSRLGHDWYDEYEVDYAPTCTKDGQESRHCSRCNWRLDARPIPAGHPYGEWEQVGDAKCGEYGKFERYCSLCGQIEVMNAPADHDYSIEKNVVEATCTTAGSKTLECSCGATKTEIIPATGHNYESVVTTPTCTEKGYTTYTCACGETYIDDYVDALGHTPATAVEENYVAPNCTEKGSIDIVVYCSVCDEEISRETEEIDANGHSYKTVITSPTCTEQGYTTYTCSVCGDTYVDDEVSALGHADGNVVEENYVAPTCTENGSKDIVTYCTVCNVETNRETVVVSATGHNYVNGKCENCGDNDVYYYNGTFHIQSPSTTSIRHKDGIKLHAKVEGTAPAGSYVKWTASNGKFKTEEINDGNSLKIVSDSNGKTTFTATLYSAEGEILATDTIEMNSKAGFFDKIGSFFRSIFGGTKIYEN